MTENKADPLLPCPFCGKPGAICCLEDEPGSPMGFWVSCSCGIETNERRTEDEARVLWNTRVALAAPQPAAPESTHMTDNKADPLREALEPFLEVAKVMDFYTEDSMPEMTFPRRGCESIYPDEPRCVTLTSQDFARLAALAAPQPAAPLGGREAIARIIDPYAYADPDNMTPTERTIFGPIRRSVARCKADAILAIPQERGVDRAAIIERLQDNVQRIDRCLADLRWKPSRAHLEGNRNMMKDVIRALAGKETD